MTLNLDIIGKRLAPVPFSYDQDSVILYALGIGAGVQEFDFVYEKNLMVFPTFASIVAQPASISLTDQAGLNMPAVLYGGQKVVFHAVIPTSGTIYTTAVCSAIYDKGGKGAIIHVDLESRDERDKVLFENEVVIVDRSAGNFGGGRGPKAEKIEIPKGKASDFYVQYSTSPNQAALYRLSGDKNPLHIDPEFARLAGLKCPILHGLCVFGFTGRAILHSVCGSNPERFKSFSARFMGVVFPGETLIIEGWCIDSGKYLIQTKTLDGRVVLSNGMTEIV